MRPGRLAAIAAALTGAVASAGCGLGAGANVGEVELTVTRDFGATPVLERSVDEVKESDTVLRLLDESAKIETRYGGGFVQSIDGTAGGRREGRFYDWFFFVNGIESSIGSAEYRVREGDSIWWDYRDWTSAMQVPAVVGSFPEPFAHGYEGRRQPTEVVCETARRVCATVRSALERTGARIAARAEDAIKVLVGPWSALRHDPVAARIEDGPQQSGVFVDFVPRPGGFLLVGLRPDGEPGSPVASDAGLIAATRRYEQPPVWVVTGTSGVGVRDAAAALDAAALRDHYAVAIDRGEETPLPLP